MIDSLFQALSTVQSNQQPTPRTFAATTVITPDTFLTFITGSTAIATITPPVQGTHVLAFIFTATNGTFNTTGNVKVAVAATQNVPVFLVFNPIEGKYYGGAVS